MEFQSSKQKFHINIGNTQVRGDGVSGMEKAGACTCAFSSTWTLLMPTHPRTRLTDAPSASAAPCGSSDSLLFELPHGSGRDAICRQCSWSREMLGSLLLLKQLDHKPWQTQGRAVPPRRQSQCRDSTKPQLTQAGPSGASSRGSSQQEEAQHCSPCSVQLRRRWQTEPAAHCGFHPRIPNSALEHLTRSRLMSRCHHN